jgi:membrane-associated phospholipid phosphatase
MDKVIFLWLHQLVGLSTTSDALILFIAEYLGYFVVLGLLFYLLRQRRKRLVGLLWYLAVNMAAIVAWFLASLLKYSLALPRPFLVLSQFHPLFSFGNLDSFPSGHAVFFAGLAGALWAINRRAGVVTLVLAILIGLARVIAGVHWPSDVLAGLIFGFVIGYWLLHLIKEMKGGLFRL